MPDGTTPAAQATLILYQIGAYQPTATIKSLADGSYQFPTVPLGNYVLNVYDSANIFRNYALFTIATSGQTLTQDVIHIGLGTVKGTVSNPDGTAAANIAVNLVPSGRLTAALGVNADASGNYTIANVPAESFQVTAQNLSQGLSGTVAGAVTKDGDIETVNIPLSSNIVALGQTLTDFNNFPYDIQKDGSILSGAQGLKPLSNVGIYPPYTNAFRLSLFQSGTTLNFTGATTGTTSLAGRQIAIAQPGLADLNLTRKIYVPSDGYFARYLELLTNPTSSPITVDVQVSGGIQQAFSLQPHRRPLQRQPDPLRRRPDPRHRRRPRHPPLALHRTLPRRSLPGRRPRQAHRRRHLHPAQLHQRPLLPRPHLPLELHHHPRRRRSSLPPLRHPTNLAGPGLRPSPAWTSSP
ncbi:carboxypeptidase-like regulatory domain-containing protein [Granulicella tundricola]|uniref:carboxypeptidase-like regulatory domain-containing protein n=1 Tax=Granulicella tundricola TaxID=940615 RepID=UPI0001DB7A58|nr:carboxypeptidase-like regulatory domain-containing protein [Granulicella tundricola]